MFLPILRAIDRKHDRDLDRWENSETYLAKTARSSLAHKTMATPSWRSSFPAYSKRNMPCSCSMNSWKESEWDC